MKTTFIYYLRDNNYNIRYIGKSNNPQKRLYNHITESRSIKKSYKLSWIRQVVLKGERPILEIIDEVPVDEWPFWECYWIDQFKAWGFNLTNLTEGGKGGNGYNHTEESKQRMRLSKIGTKQSEETKLRRSEAIKASHKENPKYNITGKNKSIIIDNAEICENNYMALVETGIKPLAPPQVLVLFSYTVLAVSLKFPRGNVDGIS